jgi:hypothetical protein
MLVDGQDVGIGRGIGSGQFETAAPDCIETGSYGLDLFKERAGQGGSGTYMVQAQALFASLTRDLSGEGWMARVFV